MPTFEDLSPQPPWRGRPHRRRRHNFLFSPGCKCCGCRFKNFDKRDPETGKVLWDTLTPFPIYFLCPRDDGGVYVGGFTIGPAASNVLAFDAINPRLFTTRTMYRNQPGGRTVTFKAASWIKPNVGFFRVQGAPIPATPWLREYTGPLAANATAQQIETAVNALRSPNSCPRDLRVTGNPFDACGCTISQQTLDNGSEGVYLFAADGLELDEDYLNYFHIWSYDADGAVIAKTRLDSHLVVEAVRRVRDIAADVDTDNRLVLHCGDAMRAYDSSLTMLYEYTYPSDMTARSYPLPVLIAGDSHAVLSRVDGPANTTTATNSVLKLTTNMFRFSATWTNARFGYTTLRVGLTSPVTPINLFTTAPPLHFDATAADFHAAITAAFDRLRAQSNNTLVYAVNASGGVALNTGTAWIEIIITRSSGLAFDPAELSATCVALFGGNQSSPQAGGAGTWLAGYLKHDMNGAEVRKPPSVHDDYTLTPTTAGAHTARFVVIDYVGGALLRYGYGPEQPTSGITSTHLYTVGIASFSETDDSVYIQATREISQSYEPNSYNWLQGGGLGVPQRQITEVSLLKMADNGRVAELFEYVVPDSYHPEFMYNGRDARAAAVKQVEKNSHKLLMYYPPFRVGHKAVKDNPPKTAFNIGMCIDRDYGYFASAGPALLLRHDEYSAGGDRQSWTIFVPPGADALTGYLDAAAVGTRDDGCAPNLSGSLFFDIDATGADITDALSAIGVTWPVSGNGLLIDKLQDSSVSKPVSGLFNQLVSLPYVGLTEFTPAECSYTIAAAHPYKYTLQALSTSPLTAEMTVTGLDNPVTLNLRLPRHRLEHELNKNSRYPMYVAAYAHPFCAFTTAAENGNIYWPYIPSGTRPTLTLTIDAEPLNSDILLVDPDTGDITAPWEGVFGNAATVLTNGCFYDADNNLYYAQQQNSRDITVITGDPAFQKLAVDRPLISPGQQLFTTTPVRKVAAGGAVLWETFYCNGSRDGSDQRFRVAGKLCTSPDRTQLFMCLATQRPTSEYDQAAFWYPVPANNDTDLFPEE